MAVHYNDYPGGYMIIDLEGATIDETPVTIPGIYAKIANSQKPVYVTNYTSEGEDYSLKGGPLPLLGFDEDMEKWIFGRLSVNLGDSSVLIYPTGAICVTNEDVVTAVSEL